MLENAATFFISFNKNTELEITHLHLNDHTVAGMRMKSPLTTSLLQTIVKSSNSDENKIL